MATPTSTPARGRARSGAPRRPASQTATPGSPASASASPGHTRAGRTGTGRTGTGRASTEQANAGQANAGQASTGRPTRAGARTSAREAGATTRDAARSAQAARTFNPLLISYYLIGGSTLLLALLGLVMVLSSTAVRSIAAGESPYAKFLTQGLYALVGLAAMAIASRMRPRAWKALAWPLLLGAWGLQALVFVPGFGVATGGNRNWLIIGGQSFQPSEVVKLALLVWLSVALANLRSVLHKWRYLFFPILPVCAISLLAVLAGKDLGTAAVMACLIFGALFVAGVPLRVLFVALAGCGAVFAVLAQTSNRLDRISQFLQGHPDTLDAGYQAKHGLFALASGGWFGLGLGNSREKWFYLPEAHNDFIFAIIGEELGLVGTLLVLVLFAILAIGLMQVVLRHPDSFARIAAGTAAAWILAQALVNIAVVIGFAPVLGVPLPLVSSGGSALITTLAAIGVVLSAVRSDPDVGTALRSNLSAITGAFSVTGRRRAAKGPRGAVR